MYFLSEPIVTFYSSSRMLGWCSAYHFRMKNVELIELGRHRIKPWYFSPYPIGRRT